MTGIQALRQDHWSVSGLIEEIERSRSQDSETVRCLVARLAVEIETHLTLEERLLYPALARIGVDVGGALALHRRVRALLTEFQACDPGSSEFFDRGFDFKRELLRLIFEEEERFFREAGRLGPRALADLDASLDRARRRLGVERAVGQDEARAAGTAAPSWLARLRSRTARRRA